VKSKKENLASSKKEKSSGKKCVECAPNKEEKLGKVVLIFSHHHRMKIGKYQENT
jgi:hypothetical protein